MASKHFPQSVATNAYDLLSEIVNLILDEPLRYNQSNWLLTGIQLKDAGYQPPMCNTIGCVAGWATSLKNQVPANYDRYSTTHQFRLEANATRLLGLTGDQATELFGGSAVAEMYESIHGPNGNVPKSQTIEYALLGALHIRAFQAQHADQLRQKAV